MRPRRLLRLVAQPARPRAFPRHPASDHPVLRARRGLELLLRRRGLPLSRTRPTREDLLAARGKTVPDVIAPDLRVLFCGINPGLYTAAIGHHFGRPGNRFWPALHRAGFTGRQLDPSEERELLRSGWGITNVVARATATADEVTAGELAAGGRELVEKARISGRAGSRSSGSERTGALSDVP